MQAELRLGQGVHVSRRRVRRLMKDAGISGLVKVKRREDNDPRTGRESRRRDLSSAVFEYIEAFNNRQQRHSTLGYLSPEEFERGRITTTKTT